MTCSSSANSGATALQNVSITSPMGASSSSFSSLYVSVASWV